MKSEIRIDSLLPPEMARRAEYIGVRKAEAPAVELFALAVLAGAFIALGAVFATTVAAGSSGVVPFGIARLIVGLVFSLGLILVVIGGAELFTGNTLLVMAWAGEKVTTRALLRNWGIVYVGNTVGALATAVLVFLSGQHTFGDFAVGKAALAIADGKMHFDFVQAVLLGVLCNALVCLAVWLTFSARTTIDKIAAIVLPVAAFVAAGFEHSIANLYFVPIGILIKDFDPALGAEMAPQLPDLGWWEFFAHNLLPVTIGNIIGGAVLVAAVYWAIYLRNKDS